MIERHPFNQGVDLFLMRLYHTGQGSDLNMVPTRSREFETLQALSILSCMCHSRNVFQIQVFYHIGRKE